MSERSDEDGLIARYFAPLAGPGGLGLRDDAALVTPTAGRDLVLTKDALVAGVHFFPDDPPDAIARKALRVNISDLAAKGASPQGFLLALALPKDWTEPWLAEFARGLGEDSREYDCPLLGGDTVSTPGPLTISITALGDVPRGRMVPRTGVKPGDRLYVSGTIGDSALGLQIRLGRPMTLAKEMSAHLLDRYLLPRPRLALAAVMRRHANAGMDVSDGLVGDLSKMLRVSGVGARIDLRRVPLSPAAKAAVRADAGAFDVAVTGGDDYEVLAAVPTSATAMFEADSKSAGVDVACIGEAQATSDPVFIGIDGRERGFKFGSFRHF